MSCKSDLSKLVAEIEWLVKDHSGSKLARNEEPKSFIKSTNARTICNDEFYTMKITLDIFVKLHQMLQNYIGLLDFRGAKSRGFDEVKIPLKEALDVAVRAMISTMQSPVSNREQMASSSVCHNCIKKSGCSEDQSGNIDTDYELSRLPEVKEVDEKLQRLKKVTFENIVELEMGIKDVLHTITKLPCTLMESRLEILSSVVKNMKNKLTSCGRTGGGPASLMGTQVNPISQIISEFILEYGQIKSQIYPCRKICRFCGNTICHVDRQKGIFCCENAKHLNFLWKEWIRQNSVNGVAKWDEETIMSIVDSFRSEISQAKRKNSCLSTGPCATAYTTPEQRCSRLSGRYEEASNVKPELVVTNLRHDRGQGSSFLAARTKFKGDIDKKNSESRNRREKMSSSDLSRGKNQGDNISDVPGIRGSKDGKNRVKVVRSNTGEKRSEKNDPEVKRSEVRLIRRGSKRGGIHAADSINGKNVSREVDDSNNEAFDVDKTGRKKASNKDANRDLNLNVAVDGVGNRKKDVTIKNRKEEGDSVRTRNDVEDKRQRKSTGKKAGEHPNAKGDQRIRNTFSSGMESKVESMKKKQRDNHGITNNRENGGEDEHKTFQDDVTSSMNQKGNTNNSGKEARRSERGLESGNTDIGMNSGIQKRVNKNLENLSGRKTREKEEYDSTKWEQSSREGREEKSGNEPREDSKNIIQYQLSNELFIELGWTLLPKDTVMRRVVEFQALKAKPHMNWFKNNRIHGKQYYTDENTIFLDFLEDGSGHAYYPNGQIAIEAKISQKGTHELYKVYAQEGRDKMGMMRLPWLMGVFDSMGNGVVYDENCDVRITYNQNGGVFVDNPSKVPFSWGWNNFQTSPIDEPVYEDHRSEELQPNLLQPVTKNTFLRLDSVKNSISQASDKSNSSKMTSSKKISEDQSIPEVSKGMNIETMKIVKKKCVAPMKPICLKMNKYLSLRILDRRNINLKFFAGQKSIRIELGTDVNPNVQINSELVDSDDWATKMTRSRFDVNVIQTSTINSSNAEDSLLEIAEEIQRAKNEANLRQLMIAKYKPHLISSSNCNN